MIGLQKIAKEIRPHQQSVVDRLKDQNELLVYHGLGSGKTRAALLAGQQLNMPLTVVGPASLRHNFDKEKKKFKMNTKVDTYTYNKPPETARKGIMVFDEAHRMGQVTSKRSHLPDTLRGEKTIFLTGTPIRNRPSELIPLLRGLKVKVPRDVAGFDANFIEKVKQNPGLFAKLFMGVKPGVRYKAKNLAYLRKALEGKVDYHKAEMEGYPTTKETTIPVEMTRKQNAAYNMAMREGPDLAYKVRHGIAPSASESGRMNAFLTAARQISNVPGKYNLSAGLSDSPKISRAISEVIKRYNTDKNYRGVTYSNYIGHGISPLGDALAKAKVPYAEYTGKVPQHDRDQMIRDYNSGLIKQLLISGAGGEGLDLKGTKLMQILEPHWNEPTIDQVKGRAIRYMSHAHLPENERNVEIQNYVARPRKRGFIFRHRDIGTDDYLRQLSANKEGLNEQFLNMLREVGSNKGK